jgi:hypothetical protein
MKTLLGLIPIYTLRLGSLNHPKSIMAFCRQHNIQKSVYTFLWKGRVMKYGKTYSNGQPGERMYRQAWYIPGWTQVVNNTIQPLAPPRSSSGCEMTDICKDIHNETSLVVNKNDVLLIIEDMTTYPISLAAKPGVDVDIYEAEKIEEYINAHGIRPIGNIREEKLNANRTIVTDNNLDNIFTKLSLTV